MKQAISFLVILLLTACAGPKPTQIDVELERYRMTAVAECYKARSLRPSQMLADAKDQALVLMAEALANRDKPDECASIAGMNAHEARVKIAETQNQALGSTISSLIKGATAITGIVVAGDVVKTGMKNSGDKTSITGDNNTNVNGDDMSNTATSYSYDMHTETVSGE